MDWFPKISDYSPHKVGNVLKQDKTKQQHQKEADDTDRKEDKEQSSNTESPKKNDGLLDIYV